jgi:hypothetical protein
LAAVQQHGYALAHAAEELRADRDVVLAAVQQNGDALWHAAEELKADRDVVLAAVQQNGFALMVAAAELRADRDVVLAASQQDGHALQYAAEELQVDEEIVRVAHRPAHHTPASSSQAAIRHQDGLQTTTPSSPEGLAHVPQEAAQADETKAPTSASPTKSLREKRGRTDAVSTPRLTRRNKQLANANAAANPIELLDSDDEDAPVVVAETSRSGGQPMRIKRIKREVRDAAIDAADAAGVQEAKWLAEEERVRVKRERTAASCDTALGDVQVVRDRINLTDQWTPAARVEPDEEYKPCPVCKCIVTINRTKQSSSLHCGLGHCRAPTCEAEFCWECGEVLCSSRRTRVAVGGGSGHLRSLGGSGCPTRVWW